MRFMAILCALWFGVMPWWVYERSPHYGCGYWAHLRLNLGLAWRWGWRRETEEDREFEQTTNARPNWTRFHQAKGTG